MEKLKKFNKNNRERNLTILGVLIVVSLLIAGISYAVYQHEDEVLFINTRVGNFETSSSDIELAMTLDGEDVDVPPNKGYYNVTVECDYADGSWNNDKWLAEMGNITSNRVKCNVNFKSYKLPIQDVKIEDYISMTPTSTSYSISPNLTGYSATQEINPSELNLWRVISKNEDSTVEVVSEYVSSTSVYFRGQTGYMNLVGGLNTIASQYTNSKYVQNTRHMGYSNQTRTCSSLSSCPTDTGYQTDINLIQVALGTLVAKTTNGVANDYWVASRNFYVDYYTARLICSDGTFCGTNDLLVIKNTGTETAQRHTIRPILTLKSDIVIISGDGKSAGSAYQLN